MRELRVRTAERATAALLGALLLACAGAAREADRPFTAGIAQVEDFTVHELPLETGFATVTVRGQLPDPCTRIDRIERRLAASRIDITITTRRESGVICAQVLTPFSHSFQLDLEGAQPGLYHVTVNGLTRSVHLSGSLPDDPVGAEEIRP